MGIKGIGPDQPTVTNEAGAKQSDTPYRFDLLPPESMFAVAKVVAEGATKYGDWNWLGIPVEDHLNHAIQHIYGRLAGDPTDAHLEHALCRLMFAVRVDLGNHPD